MGPGRAAGVPVTVHAEISQGGFALLAKRAGFGVVIEGALDHRASKFLVKQGE